MELSESIKRFREERGLLQKQVATELGLGVSHYSKIENGQREASVKILDKLAKFYGVTIDAIVHLNGEVPQEVKIEDKTTLEQMKLIQELNEKDRETIFSIIDTMLSKQRFQNFVTQNFNTPK
jgi:transcriptional regulator with XRE-family HTH domain